MRDAAYVCASDEYDALAPFYDDFTAGSNYERWTDIVLALAAELGFRGSTLLDLACGTGKSFVPFLARGYEVTACDISRGMLAEAALKAPDVRLFQADVRELGRVGSFDLVTCFDDSLNYLLHDDDLARALATIAANLAPSGLALFDLNALLAYRGMFARDIVAERGGALFAWHGECAADAGRGCRAEAGLDVFAARADGLYERVGVRHVQRHFPPETVEPLLAAAGLECRVYGVLEDGSLEPELDEARHLKVLYAARHAKGGDVQ
jgi:SAM-dependent methyltransferase